MFRCSLVSAPDNSVSWHYKHISQAFAGCWQLTWLSTPKFVFIMTQSPQPWEFFIYPPTPFAIFWVRKFHSGGGFIFPLTQFLTSLISLCCTPCHKSFPRVDILNKSFVNWNTAHYIFVSSMHTVHTTLRTFFGGLRWCCSKPFTHAEHLSLW